MIEEVGARGEIPSFWDAAAGDSCRKTNTQPQRTRQMALSSGCSGRLVVGENVCHVQQRNQDSLSQ